MARFEIQDWRFETLPKAELTPQLQILCGHVLTELGNLPDESVQCIVTSPPYWGLRDYKTEPQMWGTNGDTWTGSLGLEPTIELYVRHLTEIFRECRRVLRKDGTLWLNLGDSYAASGRGGGGGSFQDKDMGTKVSRENNRRKPVAGLKDKDLCGIPWRVAFSLQADGWWLRSDIIWAKPNAMPESVRDRPTRSHEYIFLVTKSARYFYDARAIEEPSTKLDWASRYDGVALGNKSLPDDVKNGIRGRAGRNAFRGQGADRKRSTGPANRDGREMRNVGAGATRNKRNVWTIATQPYKEAHFATFPEDLIKPCILAGSKAGDVVLDPFGGSGTVGKVALELGRQAILIELNPAYVEMAQRRCTVTAGLPL